MTAFQAIAGGHDKPSNEVLACLRVSQQGVSMKLIIQKASVRWQGGSNGGTRAMTTESGALKKTGFSLGIPFTKNSGTNPAELIAAAHAGSFSLALSNELGLAGSAGGDIVVTATVTLEHLAAGWTIMNIHLNVIARLPKITQNRFIDATVRAKTSCLVSRLLRVNTSMNARLEQ
jgi:osmotically inducible protein OsmC